MDVDAVVNFTIGAVVVGGLIGVGLWIWMAFANRAGHHWARIVGTVFFGIATLSSVGTLAVVASGASTSMGSSGTPLGTALSILGWLIGLVVVILLWNRQSSDYFKPPPAAYGYGYQPPTQAPGYQPPGYQPPGYQPPPPGGPPPGGQPPWGGPQDPPPPQ
jgi:hypothetical protein